MPDDNDKEILVNSPEPHVDILLQEYKQAGVMPNGFYDMAFNEETRRMIWAGQSPDGRRWDQNMPEGQEALPWDGAADTRVPLVDGVVNFAAVLLTAAFRKAELRATTVNLDQVPTVAGISDYLHWWVHTKYKKDLRLEAELSAQYEQEYGFAIAYVGWEREIGKRRIVLKLDTLQDMADNAPEGSPMKTLPQEITDPTQDAASAEALRDLYRLYVMQQMSGGGFYDEEQADERFLDLQPSSARKYVKQLREKGQAEVPVPYVVSNKPLVRVCKPFQEILCARGTMMLQQSRAIFWRRWMTEAELMSKRVDGWDPDWIEAVKKTKGNISAWAGALGATSLTGPSTKTVGNTTYLKVTEENNPLIEVVYAYVKKVDEDGVTGVYETIFSPHVTHTLKGETDFCARHTLINYAHGQYPFVELKRESIGRALTDTRSVGEVAATWQYEEKKQRDMLFNRADWDTMPPVKVPKLGGVDYRLGPGAQVPMSRAQDISAINLDAPPPTLALELVQMIGLQADTYFGRWNQQVHPALLAAIQEKLGDDFYTFWTEVLLMMLSLQLQFNPQEIVQVTGNAALGNLDPFDVMNQVTIGMDFDLKDLDPDYLMQKLDIINQKLIPGDVTGTLDRAGLTAYQARAVDPRMAQMFIQDKGAASQKVFDQVQDTVAKAMLGFEPTYQDASNDPTAPMKLQYLQNEMSNNPKIKQWAQQDERFAELLQNYAKNLQMGVDQQQNKQIGRIGVKPLGSGGGSVPGQPGAGAPGGAAIMPGGPPQGVPGPGPMPAGVGSDRFKRIPVPGMNGGNGRGTGVF